MTEYFVYDDDEGFEILSTKKEAIERAGELMEKYKTHVNKNGMFDAKMFIVCWGEIKQRVTLTLGLEDVK